MATGSSCSSSSSCCGRFYCFLIGLGKVLQPLILLAMRLFWGYLLVIGGLGKLQHPLGTVQFFQTLSIPAPELVTYLVGAVELIGGAMLFVGFGSRLAAIPIIIVMVTAYLTAHAAAFHELASNPQALVQQPPFNFVLTALLVLAFGPGLFSIDALLKRFWCRTPHDEPKTEQPQQPQPKPKA